MVELELYLRFRTIETQIDLQLSLLFLPTCKLLRRRYPLQFFSELSSWAPTARLLSSSTHTRFISVSPKAPTVLHSTVLSTTATIQSLPPKT